MDLIDLWWNSSQQSAINELRTSLHAQRTSSATTLARQSQLLNLMEQEQDELRLRLGVLIRLLIEKGIIAPEQFSKTLTEAKASLAQAAKPAPASPAPKRLPKPPRHKLPPVP